MVLGSGVGDMWVSVPPLGGWQCLPGGEPGGLGLTGAAAGTHSRRAHGGPPAEAAGALKRQGEPPALSGASTGLSGPGEQLRAGPEGTEIAALPSARGPAWAALGRAPWGSWEAWPQEGGTDLH